MPRGRPCARERPPQSGHAITGQGHGWRRRLKSAASAIAVCCPDESCLIVLNGCVDTNRVGMGPGAAQNAKGPMGKLPRRRRCQGPWPMGPGCLGLQASTLSVRSGRSSAGGVSCSFGRISRHLRRYQPMAAQDWIPKCTRSFGIRQKRSRYYLRHTETTVALTKHSDFGQKTEDLRDGGR
jgi:hypothetical protein